MSELSRRLASLSAAKRQLLEERLRQAAEPSEPIAVVGMACRLPGARNTDAFWQLICDGRDATGEIPPNRWNAEEFYDPTGQTPGKMSSRWGGFIDNIDQFDPMFFGIAPREAKRMDPQQRLLMEVAWEALESGGIVHEQLSRVTTGVLVGIGGTDYSKVPAQYANYFEQIDAHAGTGNALSIAANRLSYWLDLHGPSLAVDTACSSGLVCVHLAVQSLRRRESDAMLVGAVNLILTPETMIAFSKARMLSPDGRCRPFDAEANGYVRGEGCVVVVLKRLADARRDGDRVLAVIRGTAVNQDGRTSGITAPNSGSQRAVLQAALADARIEPAAISYLEAHGTGTPLGDPIEVQALAGLFTSSGGDVPPCHMASVKANIGHTETVSGLAGLVKVILMARHGLIPPQAGLRAINPNIALRGTRLCIPARAAAWRPIDGRRIAGVSSFGFGGTNAHVVLEEADLECGNSFPLSAAVTGVAGRGAMDAFRGDKSGNEFPHSKERPAHLLVLSAKSEAALKQLAIEYTERGEGANIADVCYTAATGRCHFNHRLAVVGESAEQIERRLAAFCEGAATQGVKSGVAAPAVRPRLAMLFTGQGSQHVGMGRRLYETQPVFRRAIQQCGEILRGHLDRPLVSVLYPENGCCSPLDQTAYTQPALVSIEFALAELWRSWGVEPDVVVGHSLGEYVAACVAGAMGLEDMLRLVAARARLMQQLPAGGLMAAVLADEQRVRHAVAPHADRVAIAAISGPGNVVLSGEGNAVRAILAELQAEGAIAQQLAVSHAFHSPLVEPMLDEFERTAAKIRHSRPRLPIISNLTGRLMDDAGPDARYWREHARGTVLFAAGIETLAEQSVQALVEVGPTPVLLGLVRRTRPGFEAVGVPSLLKGRDDWQTLLASLAELYVAGVKIDWQGFDAPWPRRRVRLPSYPFQRTHVWLDLPERRGQRAAAPSADRPIHPLLGHRVTTALETSLFEGRLGVDSPAWLADHQVQGSPVAPAAVYLEQALAAAEQVLGPGAAVVENVSIQNAMFLSAGADRRVQVTLSPPRGGRADFQVFASPLPQAGEGLGVRAVGDDQSVGTPPHPNPLPLAGEGTSAAWTLHASGSVRLEESAGGNGQSITIDLEATRRQADGVMTHEQFYGHMDEVGLHYGPTFRVLDDLRGTGSQTMGVVRLTPATQAELPQYRLHPILLDACLQTTAGVVPRERDGSPSRSTYMPAAVRRLVVHGPITGELYTYAVRTSDDDRPSPETVEADVFLVDASGRVLVELLGVRLQRVGRAASIRPETDVRRWLYRVRWQPKPLVAATARPANGQPPRWLILADRQGVGKALAERLTGRGAVCTLVRSGEAFPENVADWRGVVHLWSLDIEPPSIEGGLDDAIKLGCGSALELLKRLAKEQTAHPPAVWLVTRGAQSVVGWVERSEPHQEELPTAFVQAALWGMGRSAAVELPEHRCRLIDLDPQAAATEAAERLAAELQGDPEDDQIALRGPLRYVARLCPALDALPPDDTTAGGPLAVPRGRPFQLRLANPGTMESLRYEPAPRRSPEAGQVELDVHHTGLNFSDVLKAMGLYPGIRDAVVPLGIECAGVVNAVGPGVERFRPGDRVLGVAPYALASHATTAEFALTAWPDGLSGEEAATIPIAFLTAYYALVRLGRIERGERVLIHAAAGGVGQAAIQIARHAGAEILATTGSPSKREFLRSLGIEHVFSSRDDFAEEVMRVTGRRGVDLVLNSLPGEVIARSLACLGPYGRFLEIGKIDIYQNRMMGLYPFQDNLSYFAIDLDRLLRQKPKMVRGLFDEILEHFRRGVYRPLLRTTFPAEQTLDAFRYMAQRRNVGKVVVEMQASGSPRPLAGEGSIRSDATYLITGGLGALGLQVAQWLTEQGASHLVLLGHHCPSEQAAATIRQIESSGARVTTIRADVADRESLRAALAQLPADFPPLAGVIHAAGVLDDRLLLNMEPEHLRRVMAPKIAGAWNLHEATLNAKLDFFVLFSSVAAVLGSPGQANYAAANAAMDALAHERRARGLPATSINWGPWSGSGMATAEGRAEQIEARGLGLLPPDRALELLGRALQSDATDLIVVDARWPELRRAMGGRVPPLLEMAAGDRAETVNSQTRGSGIDHALRDLLRGLNPQRRRERLCNHLRDELARIMGTEAAQLDVAQPLNGLGLDSLMAIELKNGLETRLGVALPMARLLEGPSIEDLAGHAAELLTGEQEGSGVVPANPQAGWIVPLQRNGSGAPLFCLHAAGGDVRCYHEMARGVSDRPVYALRAQGLDDGRPPHRSLRAMAEDYLAEIERIDPAGPYHLVGWSTGGVFAFALAELLQQRARPAASLVLIDTPSPSLFSTVDPEDDVRFLYDLVHFSNRAVAANMQLSMDELRRMAPEERFQTALTEAKRRGVLPAEASTDYVRRFVEVCRAHVQAIRDYRPQPLRHPIHLLLPADSNVLSEVAAELAVEGLAEDHGWGAVASRVVVEKVAGDHFSMMTAANAPRLARAVLSCFQEATSHAS